MEKIYQLPRMHYNIDDYWIYNALDWLGEKIRDGIYHIGDSTVNYWRDYNGPYLSINSRTQKKLKRDLTTILSELKKEKPSDSKFDFRRIKDITNK